MTFEYEGCYAYDEPASRLMSAGILTPDYDDVTARALIDAWKLGFDAGAEHVQREWDQAEELRAESAAGWDW